MATPSKPGVPPPGILHARRSAMLMLVGLVASGFPLPYNAAAVIPLAWAGFESVRAIRARSADGAQTRTMVSSVFGLVLVCLLTAMVLLPYAVYGKAKGLQECASGANTAAAMADCNSRFLGGRESFLGGFLSFGQRAGG